MDYHLHSGIYGLRSHSALGGFPIDDSIPVFVLGNDSWGWNRGGTGVKNGLSTVGFDKSCIAYSAAYTYAYYSLLLTVFMVAFLVVLRCTGLGRGGLFWERDRCLGVVDGKVGYSGWWWWL